MINVTFYYDDSAIKGFVAEGHADMQGAGEFDLVCASVSAVMQTALIGLDTYVGDKAKWKIEENGYLECWLTDGLNDAELKQANVIICTMELGLLNIEESYGDCLKVSKRRWTGCNSK